MTLPIRLALLFRRWDILAILCVAVSPTLSLYIYSLWNQLAKPSKSYEQELYLRELLFVNLSTEVPCGSKTAGLEYRVV